jgi:hypothetical protein
VDVEAGLCPGGRRQPAVVRPAPTGRDQGIRALGEGGPDEELEVPQLVPTEGQGQEIFALDPDLGPATEGRGKTAERRQRRRTIEQGEPRQRGDPERNDHDPIVAGARLPGT